MSEKRETSAPQRETHGDRRSGRIGDSSESARQRTNSGSRERGPYTTDSMEPKTRVRRRLYYPSYVFAENTLRAFNFWGHPLIRAGETFLSNCIVGGVRRKGVDAANGRLSIAGGRNTRKIDRTQTALLTTRSTSNHPSPPETDEYFIDGPYGGYRDGTDISLRSCARTYAVPGNRSRLRYVCGKRNVRTTDEYRGITRASGSG